MRGFSSFIFVLSLTVAFRSSEAFVYTCNEIKYSLVPNNLSITTPFACIVHQSNVKINFDDEIFDGANVRDLFLVDGGDGQRYNFIDIANSTEHCLSGTGPWRVESEAPIDELDCSAEVTLLFSSVQPNVFIPKILGDDLDSDVFVNGEVTVVSPNGGINFNMFYLGENETGSIDFYSGVGAGPEEEMVLLRKQEYTSDDVNLYHFGPVATLKMEKPFAFSFIVSGIVGSYSFSYSPIGFKVISSGAASVLQSTQNERIQINYGLGAIVTLTGSVIFDQEIPTTINVSCTDDDDVVWGEIEISESGEVNWTSQCRFLDFIYIGTLPKEETARRSSERVDLSLTAVDVPSTPTLSTTTTVSISTMTPLSTRRTMPTRSITMRHSTTTHTTTTTSMTTTTARPTTSVRAEIRHCVAAVLVAIIALY